MLLPGRLGTMPLMDAHMTFMGKEIDTAPQARHTKDTPVRDVMTKEVVTARQGTSLVDAAKTLSEKKISGLPILSSENKLIGILTEADFVSAMDIAPGKVGGFVENVVRKRRAKKSMGTIVDDIMTRKPVTVGPDDSVSKAIMLMEKHRIKRLIVTDGNEGVAGMVSRHDLMKLFTMK
jgi:CBS domain-containing protein